MAGAAPVYSLADENRARSESAAWARFTSSADSHELYASWLALLAARVERARAALLLVAEDDRGTFGVAAVWPDPRQDLQYLGPVAQRALAERQGVVAGPDGGPPGSDGAAQVAYPVQVSGRLFGAVVVDVAPGPQADLQAALRQIHWSIAWLLDHFRAQVLAEREAELARVASLNELMASALQHRRLQPSALAVANELAARLHCDRVSVGFEERGQVRPIAISHTAHFEQRSDLVRTLAEAMDEVLDLGGAVAVPLQAGDEFGALAHVEASRALKNDAMLSVPLLHEGQTLGVITLERQSGSAFDDGEQSLAAALGVMLGPVWALQRLQERSAWAKGRDAMRSSLQAVFGPRHPGVKLIVFLLAALVAAGALVRIDHRVSARTVIEGATQLASAAPFDGFIAESFARAGDTVKQGQPLAKLDDRDLKLERARWAAEKQQLERKLQVALAQGDRGSVGVFAAQAQQADAQLALAEEKLTRATLVAPFDGVVVSGDLSQLIGTPVEQGKLLFEVAPLEGFRVVMQVDDRDIARVSVGQRGELVLSSLPNRPMPFTVSNVTPVAQQLDGRNVFRVEARVEPMPGDAMPRLRVGMEGIGKVTVGEGSLLWVWTHRFFDWLRVATWGWMP